MIEGGFNAKPAANVILGQVFRRLTTEEAKEAFDILPTPAQLRELLEWLEAGKIRMNLVKSAFEKMLDTGRPAGDFISEDDMGGLDEAALRKLCEDSIAANPKAADDVRAGKEKAVKALVGGVMRAAKGRADAQAAEKLLLELLK